MPFMKKNLVRIPFFHSLDIESATELSANHGPKIFKSTSS
jgi:hypothetical protein